MTPANAKTRLAPDPVWLEPSASGRQDPYDRSKTGRRFYRLMPSPAERDFSALWGGVLAQLAALAEPAAFELTGSADRLDAQWVVQSRDAALLASAVSSVCRHSYLNPREADPIEERYRQAKAQRQDLEYHFLDYSVEPPFYLPVFRAAGGADLLAQIHSAFSRLSPAETGFYQLLLVPCRRDWLQASRRAIRRERLPEPDQRRLCREAEDRCRRSPVFFAVALRAGGFVGKAGLRPLMRSLHGLVRSLAAGDHRLGALTRQDYYSQHLPRRDHLYLLFNRVAFHPGMILSRDETAALLPVFGDAALERASGLAQAPRTYPAPEFSPSPGQTLGLNRHRGRLRAVRLGPHLPNEHVYIVGKSGYGKTTLMESLIAQHLERGEGCGVIDPHGDLVQRIARRVPARRVADTLYFDPADPDFLVPFNVLAHSGDPVEKEHMRADLLDFFEELIGSKLGVSIEHVLNYSLITLLRRPGSTLADIQRLLADARFREELLAGIADPELAGFWRREFPSWSKNGGLTAVANKLSPLLLPGAFLAPLLSERRNSIDFAAMMDGGGIFLANLAQGSLTKRNSQLLGRLLLSRIAVTALRRDPASRPAPWYLYVDEVQDIATRSLEDILRGMRKFGLNLRLANHKRRDLPEGLRAAADNAETLVFFRNEDPAEQGEIEKILARRFAAAEIGGLGRGQAAVKMAGQVFNLEARPVNAPQTDAARAVVEHTRRRFAVPRHSHSEQKGATMTPFHSANSATETLEKATATVKNQPLEEAYDEL